MGLIGFFRSLAKPKEKANLKIQSAVFVIDPQSLEAVTEISFQMDALKKIGINNDHACFKKLYATAFAVPLCDGTGQYQLIEEQVSYRFNGDVLVSTKTPITAGRYVAPFLDLDQAADALRLWEGGMPSKGFVLSQKANQLPNHYSRKVVPPRPYPVRDGCFLKVHK